MKKPTNDRSGKARLDCMTFASVVLGFSTADGENVRLSFQNGALKLSFMNWREEEIVHTFEDVLAFCWQELEIAELQDDETYEVLESEWVVRQAGLQGVEPSDFSHFMLCFNAQGVLDVIVKRASVMLRPV